MAGYFQLCTKAEGKERGWVKKAWKNGFQVTHSEPKSDSGAVFPLDFSLMVFRKNQSLNHLGASEISLEFLSAGSLTSLWALLELAVWEFDLLV